MLADRIKELPEKLGLEVQDTDILIIEDADETCRISVKELRTALLHAESAELFRESLKSELNERLSAIEDLYPLRLAVENVSVPLSSEEPYYDLASFRNNQSSAEASIERLSIYEYVLHIKELDGDGYKFEPYLLHDGMEELKWVCTAVNFNIDSSFIKYSPALSEGAYAAAYSLDNDTGIYKYSAGTDASKLYDMNEAGDIVLWFNPEADGQKFSFVDMHRHRISITLDFKAKADVEEEPHTYTIYQPAEPDAVTDTVVSEYTETGKVLDIVYIQDIPYTFAGAENNLPQSGNWVTLKIRQLEGYDDPPFIRVDGTIVMLEGTEDYIENAPWVKYRKDESTGLLLLSLMFDENTRIRSCIFTWGPSYVDHVSVGFIGNLLYPPEDMP